MSEPKRAQPTFFRLPLELGLSWTPSFVAYWKRAGDRIGSEVASAKPPTIGNRLEARAIRVRPMVARHVTAADFNVITEKWTGPPFDLIVATNVLVYYDTLDQSLAFARIDSMLKPGGFFLTNNAVAELPRSRLRSVGFLRSVYSRSPEYSDHIFWYRREE